MRLIYVLPVWLLLSGCSFTNSAQTSISAVLAGIQEDLTKAGVVSASDVQGWSEEQAARFDANVRALQCAQRNVDPVVALVSGPVAMQLNGSLTQSGSFSVSVSALTSVPVLGITAEASRSKTQQLSLPVQFVPLSALPDAEMQREVEYAGALMSQPDTIRESEGEKILMSRQTLAAHILELQKLDVLKLCKADQPVRPFVGLHEH